MQQTRRMHVKARTAAGSGALLGALCLGGLGCPSSNNSNLTATTNIPRALATLIPIQITPDFAVASSDGSFVLAGAGDSPNIEVLDGRAFLEVPAPLTLSSGATSVASMGASTLQNGQFAVGTADGKVDIWNYSDILSFANADIKGFVDPSPIPTAANGFDLAQEEGGLNEPHSSGPVSAVGFNSAGSEVFAVDQLDAILVSDGGTVPLLLGTYTPLMGLDVSGASTEDFFIGTENGVLLVYDPSTDAVTPFEIDSTDTISGIAAGSFVLGNVPTTLMAVIDSTSNKLFLINPSIPSIQGSVSLGKQHPVGVAISNPGNNVEQTLIWVAEDDATGGANQVEAFNTTLQKNGPQNPVALPNKPLSLAEGNGYLWAGMANDEFAVITANPWLTMTVSPTTVSSLSKDATVTLTSTQAGYAQCYINNNLVASQTIDAANPTAITLASQYLTSFLVPGQNQLLCQVTNSNTELVGHLEIALLESIPPPTPGHFKVGFGDNRVIASWDAINVADYPSFSYYVVNFGTVYPGTNGTQTVGNFQGQASGQQTNDSFFAVAVTNGTTVFMSVLAVSSSGAQSPATAILSATAQATEGAAQLAGDSGGFACGVGGTGSSPRASLCGGLAALGLLAMAAKRRRARR